MFDISSLSIDRQWNLIFWLMLVVGYELGIFFIFWAGILPLGLVLLGIFVLCFSFIGAIRVVKRYNPVLFCKKTKKIFNATSQDVTQRIPGFFSVVFMMILSPFLVAGVRILLDDNCSVVFWQFICHLVIISVPVWMFIIADCPISVLFNSDYLRSKQTNYDYGKNYYRRKKPSCSAHNSNRATRAFVQNNLHNRNR